MNCPGCGAPVHPAAQFCTACGQSIQSQPPHSQPSQSSARHGINIDSDSRGSGFSKSREMPAQVEPQEAAAKPSSQSAN
ncbi:MAG: hypothetical protein WBV94_01770 [Blastocatellia bacterium]